MDITKCEGTNCPLKKTCYRYTATANELIQSYFVEPPIKDGKCEMYFGEHANDIINQLKDIMNNE